MDGVKSLLQTITRLRTPSRPIPESPNGGPFAADQKSNFLSISRQEGTRGRGQHEKAHGEARLMRHRPAIMGPIMMHIAMALLVVAEEIQEEAAAAGAANEIEHVNCDVLA